MNADPDPEPWFMYEWINSGQVHGLVLVLTGRASLLKIFALVLTSVSEPGFFVRIGLFFTCFWIRNRTIIWVQKVRVQIYKTPLNFRYRVPYKEKNIFNRLHSELSCFSLTHCQKLIKEHHLDLIKLF